MPGRQWYINYKVSLRWAGLLSPVLARSSLWGKQALGGVSSPGALSARESHPGLRLEAVWTWNLMRMDVIGVQRGGGQLPSKQKLSF